MSKELGLNVCMLDVDFLRRAADLLDSAHDFDKQPPEVARLREVADHVAQEIKDVGELRRLVRPPADVYRVTYGPAMDHADFPYTVTGFVKAIEFAADQGAGATICNPNRVDLDDPTGFTPQEREVYERLW